MKIWQVVILSDVVCLPPKKRLGSPPPCQLLSQLPWKFPLVNGVDGFWDGQHVIYMQPGWDRLQTRKACSSMLGTCRFEGRVSPWHKVRPWTICETSKQAFLVEYSASPRTVFIWGQLMRVWCSTSENMDSSPTERSSLYLETMSSKELLSRLRRTRKK